MIRPRKERYLRGLLVSWSLVAIPTSVGFLSFFILQRPSHRTMAAAVGEGLFWAVATTVLIGTLGYATVREFITDGTDSLARRDKTLLAGGLFALGVAVSIVFGWTHLYGHPAVYALIILTLLTAGYVAYRDGSIVLTIGVAACTPLALFGYVGLLRWMGVTGPSVVPWAAPLFAIVAGCVLGITAYLLGTGYRRFRPRVVT